MRLHRPEVRPGGVRRPHSGKPMYLLDTNVVSELRKPQAARRGASMDSRYPRRRPAHLGRHDREIQAGIELTREQDEGKAVELEQWLELVAGSFNVVPMDAPAFTVWARLMHRTSDTLYEDAMIAATAKVHKLTVVTRNVADFKGFGVSLLNPFALPRK